MDPFTLWLLGAAIAALCVAAISWESISNWLSGTTRVGADHLVLLKRHLENGNVAVVGGVFDRSGSVLDTKTWEGESLDEELTGRFGARQEIVLKL